MRRTRNVHDGYSGQNRVEQRCQTINTPRHTFARNLYSLLQVVSTVRPSSASNSLSRLPAAQLETVVGPRVEVKWIIKLLFASHAVANEYAQ